MSSHTMRHASPSPNLKRYLQFSLLLLAAGAIYPLLYLRQNFETSVLAAFSISADELGQFYSLLGLIYALTYLPSGWLADRFSPRLLICFSLSMVGLLGLWFSTYPGPAALRWIFIGWGLAAGLTFWASLIKGVKLLAQTSEQGRFFGILDGGRGLIEALLATAAVALFAMASDAAPQAALRPVIHMYSFTCLAIASLVLVFLGQEPAAAPAPTNVRGGLWQDLKTLAAMPRLWLMALIIFCGYQIFWATYSFSAYLQEGYGMSAVAAGVITVIKLWMRPVGGIVGGFLGDRCGNAATLAWSMLLAALGLTALILFPAGSGVYFLLTIVILIGVMTYAIRGLYWSLLESCAVPEKITGLAIGIVSVIAYSPDIFLPMINSAISHHYPGLLGYKIYFGYIVACGLGGTAVAFYFKNLTKREKVQQ
ncbi:MFS transporter [Verminephrobacter eiseniae]|uniref:MFS transporter n=1 Tax=Verminephrobacter eiseniae TaxID=364317 RepID=UPI002238A666|nr:MFS transporter [Verminephrobacter eiseniae]MCW5238391.1 MFS transporter [Verminephrobacter eiseniae]